MPDTRLTSRGVIYITFPNDAPVRLHQSDPQQAKQFWLRLRQTVIVQPRIHAAKADYHVTLDSYAYQLLRGDRRTSFDEVVTYHWTPSDPNAKRTWPHLHIGSALVDPEARREPWAFHKTHLTTGTMSAAAFVRMAVEEFGIQPVIPDWATRISE